MPQRGQMWWCGWDMLGIPILDFAIHPIPSQREHQLFYSNDDPHDGIFFPRITDFHIKPGPPTNRDSVYDDLPWNHHPFPFFVYIHCILLIYNYCLITQGEYGKK